MILLDYNQAMITGLTPIYRTLPKDDPQAMKAVFLERIRSINKKYRTNYGQLVICCESPVPSWRKDFFPFYKAHRAKNREVSKFNWKLIHQVIDDVRNDLLEFFNYPIMHIPEAEGDDIIAVLAKRYIRSEKKIMIFSGDLDFTQLHNLPGIDQYSPVTQKLVTTRTPNRDLKEKIIRGDSGDGVPNLLSKDNIFLLEDEQQARILSKNVKKWLDMEPGEFCTNEAMRRNWIRNRTLIDFEFIPSALSEAIVDAYEVQLNKPVKEKTILIDYFIDQNLPGFMSSLQDF